MANTALADRAVEDGSGHHEGDVEWKGFRIHSLRRLIFCCIGLGIAAMIRNLKYTHSYLISHVPAYELDPSIFPAATSLSQSQSLPPQKNFNNTETVIFFNIFVPSGQPVTSLKIVAQQLKTRQRSVLKGKPLIYTLITPDNVTETAAQIEAMEGCHPCSSKIQTTSGGEVLTLTQLYDHCQQYPSNRVVYMHSKGTFSPTRTNIILRRLSMKAITSRACNTEAATMLPTCSVCSAYFTGYPFFIVTGNFFVAKCEYVNKLLPPKVYQAKKEFLFETLGTYKRNVTERGPAPDFNFSMSQATIDEGKSILYHRALSKRRRWQVERKSWIAVERFAMEHWIHSHPSVNPCDVHPEWRGRYQVKTPSLIQYKPTLLVVPSERTSPYKKEAYPTWYNLPGRLFEWKFLYNELPANDSWIWKFYTEDR